MPALTSFGPNSSMRKDVIHTYHICMYVTTGTGGPSAATHANRFWRLLLKPTPIMTFSSFSVCIVTEVDNGHQFVEFVHSDSEPAFLRRSSLLLSPDGLCSRSDFANTDPSRSWAIQRHLATHEQCSDPDRWSPLRGETRLRGCAVNRT